MSLTNKEKDDIRKERQEKIIEIITNNEITYQKELIYKLNKQGFSCKQSTVSRDLQDLQISGGSGKPFYMSEKAKKDKHVSDLNSLLKEKSSVFYPNVSHCYLGIEEGKASEYALHLKKVFPDVIIDITIRMDSLVIMINNDADTEKFFKVLKKEDTL